MVTMYFTLPALAAATGFYLFHRRDSKAFGGVFPASIAGMLEKAKKDVKNAQVPRLALQFDGLHSFETLVGR